MAITDVAQNIIWATTSGSFNGTVSVGPFAPSHVKAKTSLEKHSELDDVSFVDTYIAQFVQGGAPHPVYQGTLDEKNVTYITFGISAAKVDVRGTWEVFFVT